MAKLILSMDGQTLKEYAITKERTVIGRKPHNDVQIENLAISGEHAAILMLANDCFLEDLDSTNGTYVNGKAVKKHFLQNDDVIELGKYRLRFIAEEPRLPNGADAQKTTVLRREAAQAAMAVEPAPVAPQPAPAGLPAATIQVLNGSNAGKEIDLNKSLTTLGKPGVLVVAIARRPQGHFITHIEGANAVVVGGRPLDTHAPRMLKDHDIIDLAGVKMEFFFKG